MGFLVFQQRLVLSFAFGLQGTNCYPNRDMAASAKRKAKFSADDFADYCRVVQLLNRITHNGKRYYLAQWGDDAASYEPADSFHPALIKDFENDIKSGRKKLLEENISDTAIERYFSASLSGQPDENDAVETRGDEEEKIPKKKLKLTSPKSRNDTVPKGEDVVSDKSPGSAFKPSQTSNRSGSSDVVEESKVGLSAAEFAALDFSNAIYVLREADFLQRHPSSHSFQDQVPIWKLHSSLKMQKFVKEVVCDHSRYVATNQACKYTSLISPYETKNFTLLHVRSTTMERREEVGVVIDLPPHLLAKLKRFETQAKRRKTFVTNKQLAEAKTATMLAAKKSARTEPERKKVTVSAGKSLRSEQDRKRAAVGGISNANSKLVRRFTDRNSLANANSSQSCKVSSQRTSAVSNPSENRLADELVKKAARPAKVVAAAPLKRKVPEMPAPKAATITVAIPLIVPDDDCEIEESKDVDLPLTVAGQTIADFPAGAFFYRNRDFLQKQLYLYANRFPVWRVYTDKCIQLFHLSSIDSSNYATFENSDWFEPMKTQQPEEWHKLATGPLRQHHDGQAFEVDVQLSKEMIEKIRLSEKAALSAVSGFRVPEIPQRRNSINRRPVCKK